VNRNTKVALAAGAAVVCLAGLFGGLYAVNTLLDHEKTEQFVVSEPVQKVIVASDAGDVDVVATDTDRITISQTMRWLTHEPSPERTVADGVLRLNDSCGGSWAVFRCETNYRIEVPRDLAVEVDVDAGNVSVSGVAGAVSLRSDAGDLEGTGLVSAHVKATTDAGHVELAFATAPTAIEAASDAGDVTIELPSAEYAIDAGTDAGDTSVDGIVSYDLAAHSVSAHSDAGDVTIRGR
jgi:hypothetical protein